MDYSIDGLDTLAVAGAEVATHRRVPRAEFASGHDWIDFVGPTGAIRSVSFATAYQGRQLPPDFFTGKIVVVGATAPSLQDIHPTSVDGQMPGPEIQANAVQTVLRGMPLASVPGWASVILIVLMSAAVPLLSARLGAAGGGLVPERQHRQVEPQDSPDVARQGPWALPHRRPLQRRHRARNRLGHDRQVRRDTHGGPRPHRRRLRLHAPRNRGRARRPPVPGPRAVTAHAYPRWSRSSAPICCEMASPGPRAVSRSWDWWPPTGL
jgi:CHASE2 domain